MLLFCNGKKDFCYKDVCDSSCQHHDGSGAKCVKHQTIADKIRAMTDEQMAEFLCEEHNFCKSLPKCYEALNTDDLIPDHWCVACLLEWLRKPADDSTVPKEDSPPHGFFLDRQTSGLTEEY